MKRITILIVIILLVIIGSIVCYKCCGLNEPNDCSNLIFVAVNQIPEEDYNVWEAENEDYFYDVPAEEKKIGTQEGLVAIDASKIREDEYAAWLKANGNFIFFEETYPYIECAHNVSEVNISNSSGYSSLTLAQIKSQISAKGGNFYTDNYNKYTSISINSSNIVVINLVSTFVFDKNCFSMPLFRSIVSKFNLNDNSVFQFKTATVNKKKTIVFRVQNDSGIYNYYDFSQIPP